jgi:large subunit ribosomal protein L21
LTNEEGSKFLLTKFFIRWQWIYHFRRPIEGASVEAKVLQHLKGDKVIVFKERKEKRETVIDNILLKL